VANSLPFSLETQPAHIRQALTRPQDDVILTYKGETYNLGQLHALASGFASTLKEASGPRCVALYLHSPFHLLAAILGAWKAEHEPVLIDPTSRSEIQTIIEQTPTISFIAHPSHLPDHTRILPWPQTSDTQSPHTWKMPAVESPFVSFFTSGSEGRSKLVPKLGRQVYAHVGSASHMLGAPRGCRTVSFVPLFHILGFSYGLMVPLRMGGACVAMAGQPPAAMKQALLQHRPDMVVGTAIHYRFLNAILEDGEQLPDAIYISSGAPLPANVRDRFFEKTGHRIHELYGSTETAGIAMRIGSAPWRPYPGAEVKIEDERLCVRSPWTHADPQCPWYQTHDIAEPDGDGFQLLGRAGNIIKIGGKRFSSAEVEQAIRQHPEVEDVAAVPYQRHGDEPALAAFVVTKDASTLDARALREALSQQLAPFKLPRTITFLPSLPRKKLQKLDYATLRALAQETA
tara:strand:+ start:439 stop:1815 length:1377 start_codon:yes stop_codon:yes gene_type:complete